ncbi:MAG TPA: DUF1080 domain-containing protein, partial [Gemmataceae bacterium]|nr:DUF1080 domain-containing protein [Gemmataceae bacterium]
MRVFHVLSAIVASTALLALGTAAEEKAGPKDNAPPEGFTALFNGKDLTNWQGLVELPQRKKLTPEQLEAEQKRANEKYLPHWTVQ